MKKIYFLIAFFSFFLISSFDSKATHIMGGEITWECLSNGDYQFEFKVYRDCSGNSIAPEQSGVVRIHNYPTVGQPPLTIPSSQWTVVSNGDLSPDCSAPGSFSCANSSPESAFEYVRRFTRRLVGVPPPAGWIITYSDCCRNTNDNITGQPGVSLRAKIFRHSATISDTCVDNSPKFRELATSLICVGRPFTYNPNATDDELDSLVYDWARPLNQNNGTFIEGSQPPNVNFQTGYSFNTPFPGTSQNPNNVPAVLDRNTGEISLTSFTSGKYVSVVKVTAYKCGERVAEIYRELQTNLAISPSCSNNDEPIITPPFRDASNNFTIWNDTVRAGDLVTFNIQAQDFASLAQSGGDSLTLTATGLQFGTNFTSTTGCSNPPCATLTNTLPQTGFLGINNTFSWQTDCNHVSFTDQCVSGQNTYTFVINVEDDVCPLPSNNIATISITVLADSVLQSPLINCLNVLPNGDVVLDWNPTPNIQNSFSAWMIYSSLDENGPFALVDSVKTYSQSTYIHVGAGADTQRRWYHIRSRSGCKGIVQNIAREAVSTIFVDPQVAPTQLNVNWNELDNPNPIGSAAQYRVFKEYPVGTGLNFLQNTAATTLAETFPICEDTVVYRVELVNTIESCTSSSNIAGIRFKFPDPQTDFSYTPANPCPGIPISFTNLTTIPGGTISYVWDFGDASATSTQTNPSHTYTSAGSYVVTLTASSGIGCDSVYTETINVTFPDADAGPDASICPSGNVSIGGSPTTGLGNTVAWSPSAGLSSTTVQNPVASPAATTTYTVTVTDANGCTNTDQVVVSVNPVPTADAGSNQSVCSGTPIQIGGSPTGPVGASFQWDNAGTLDDATLPNPTATPLATTTYRVTVTSGVNCSSTDQVTITVNPSPNADAGANQSICSGNSVSIGGSPTSSTPGVTYAWSNAASLNNASIANPTASPTTTTTYTVTVTSANSCTSTDQVTVTVNSLPVADAGSNQTICSGSNTTIGGSPTGPAGATFSWNNAASLNSSSAANPIASPTATTTYTVTITDVNGCSATDQVTITVSPTPTADAGSNQTICSGASVNIGGSPTGPAGATYSWSNAASLNNATIANPVASPTATTTYTVTVTLGGTCTATDQVTITVDPNPAADAGANQSICIGDNVTIGGSPTGPAGASYSWSNGASLSNASIANPVATPSTTTTYTVTVTNANSCTSTDQVTVTVNPLPTADAGSNQTICTGANVTIGGSPTGPVGATYAWNNGGSLSSASVANPIASPTVTTTYTVTVTSGINCTATDQVTVTVDPLPVADAGPDKILCSGTTTTIGSPNNPNYTYQWNNTGTIVGSSTISNPTVNTTVTRIYTVTVTETSTGCTNTDQVNVFVGSVPNANAGADRSICLGNSTQLGGSSSGVSPLTFAWDNGGTLNNANTQFPNATPLVTTTYSLTVTDGNGCTSTDQVTVTVNPNPTADAGADQTICSGDNGTIGGSPTGPAGSTYTWNNAASLSSSTAANPVATPTTTTTYTVTVTDANLCTATDQVTITVNPSPFADAGSDQSICLGDNVSIGGSPTGPAGVTYAWDNGASLSSTTVANPVATPTTTTTYTVTVTSANSCTATDQVTITVNPIPVADAGVDQTICEGSNLTIGGSPTGPAGATYAWDNGGSLSSTSVANPIADPVVTTTYTVTVTSGLNCSSTDQITITVNPTPNVDAGPDQTICDGASVTIGGSPTSTTAGVTYAWDNGASLSSTSVANPIATPTTTTTYTVTVTDANTCTSTDQVIVTVNPLPTADAGADRTICEGTNTSLGGSPTGPAGATYLWNNAGSLNNANAANPVASPLTTTTYSVTVTSGNGCTSVDQVLVTVNPAPTADAGADQTICNGSSVNLGGTPTGPAGSSFSWNNAASLSSSTAANPVATPTSTTTYTVTVTDANLCTATDQVTITVNPTPVADAGADQTICNGANVTIGGSPTGPTGATFAWDNGASLSNSTLANPVASPTSTTTYTVTVTSANLCTATDQVTITVNPLPTADAGADQTICSGTTATIGGSPTGPSGATYQWDNAATLNNASSPNPIVTPIPTTNLVTTTVYTVTVTSATGCTAVDQVTVTVNLSPVAVAGRDTSICLGESVIIGGIPRFGASNVISYSWDNAATLSNSFAPRPIATPIVTTIYTITITDGNGCTDTDEVTVTVNPLPTADAGADQTICEGSTATIGGSPTGPVGSTYTWDNGASLSSTSVSNPVANPIATTIYSVTVTDGNGCSAVDQVTITVNPAPNVDAGADQTICEGSSTTIGGSPTSTTAGVTYAWDNGASLSSTTIANPSANPIVTTTYTVTVTDANSCTSTDQIVITVNPAPNVDAGADQNLCIGNSVTIGGSPTSTTAGVTYAWDNGASLNSTTSANPSASPTVTTTYTVTVTDANSCTSTDQVTITVNPLPIVDAGADQTICEGSTASIGGTPTGPSGSTFAWDNGASLSSSAVSNPIANPITTTTYTVTVTDLNGCSATDQVTITVNPAPNVDAGADQSICEGESTTIGGSPTSTTAGVTYAWDNGASLSSTTVANPVANPIVTTTYTVTVTDGNTCTSTDQVTITVNPAPNVDAGADQTICEGTSVTIGGSPTSTTAGVTFAWDNGASLSSATIANPVANPITTTTYSVTVTDGNSCTSTDQVTITVNPAPTVDAGADQTICEGSSVTIGGSPTSSTAGVTYAWDNGGSLSSTTVANPVANPIVTTTYTITVTDANACTSIDQMTVNVDPAPNVDAGADQSICIGNSATIGGSPTSTTAGVSYAWDNAISLNDASAANPVATPLITTTYTVTITDGNTCTSTDQVTVTVNPLPIVDAGADQSICEGLNTTIGGSPTGPAGSTYLWDNAASLDDITLANPVASPLVTTTYSVTVTDVNGCVDTDNLTVTVNPSPVVDAGADQTICLRDSVQIGGSPTAPTGISFSWTPIAGLSDANAANPMASPSDTTKYFVSITDANGCISIDSMLVNVNPLPIVDFQADALCVGDFTAFTDQTTLSVGNIISWDWDFGDGLGSSNLQNPAYQYASSGSYLVTLKVETAIGCFDSIIKTVGVNPLPIADAGNDTTICFGDTVQIGIQGSSSLTYSWSPATGLSDVTASNPLASPLATGDYFLSVTDANGCFNFDTVTIFVNQLPNVIAERDTFSCVGESIQLNASGAQTYIWSPDTWLDDPTISNPIANALKNIEYTVSGTDINGCVAEDTITISVFNLDFDPNNLSICIGDTLQFNPVIQGDTTGITYLWTPSMNLSANNVQNPFAFITVDQQYILQITNQAGCDDLDSLFVEALDSAGVDFEYINSPRCNGSVLEIENTSVSTDNFEWYLNDVLVSTDRNPQFDINYSEQNVLTLVGSNANCTNSITKIIPAESFKDLLRLKDANVFTPNGDGINDFFSPGFEGKFLGCASFQIYDRWGKTVFDTNIGQYRWDGRTLGGYDAPEGVYFYVIKVGSEEIKGSLLLTR